MATHPNPNHHIVIAALGSRAERKLIGFTAVTAPLTWPDAIARWEKLEDERKAGTLHRSHVMWYAVRNVSDPKWASLVSLGYADARSRDGRRSYKGDDGKIKAAKVWAKLYGYKGAGGGWIYDASGQAHCQGWGSLAHELQRTGKIAQGTDGLWYILDLPLVEADPAGHRPAVSTKQ